MTRALIFPGQGSQFIGMGQDLFESFTEAKDVFNEVDDALSQKLSNLIFSGESDDLNLTENTQPALMAVSLAVVRVLEKQGNLAVHKICSLMAGHSLGEYSALTAAGTIGLSDSARILKLRGQAMQKAVPVGVGAMAAILGLEYDDVAKIAQDAAQGDVCDIANDNSDGQVVVSGHKDAVDRAVALASERGAKRAVLLPVSAPFHCSLMQPAAEAMQDALAGISMQEPIVPIVANVTTENVSAPDTIRDLLVKQVTGTVRWRESIHAMKARGIEEMIELGAGKVLCGLVRRTDREIETKNAGTVAEIESLIEYLS